MKAIIFDFYNTLAYISRKRNPYAKLIDLASQAKAADRNWSRWIMTHNIESLHEVFNQSEIGEQTLNQTEIEIQDEIQSVQLYSEVEEVLEKLSKKRELYLLSNLASQYKEPFYKLGLDRWIHKAFFSCEIGLLKPSPSIFEYVLKEIRKESSEVIMIGDSYRSDIIGARDCGIESIWIRRTGETSNSYIKSLKDLEKLLQYS